MELDRARKFPHSIENEEQKRGSESTGSLSPNSRSSLQRVSPFFPSPSLRFYLGKINSFILQLVLGQVDLATRRHWIQCQNLSIWIVGIVKQFKEKLYCINFFAIFNQF